MLEWEVLTCWNCVLDLLILFILIVEIQFIFWICKIDIQYHIQNIKGIISRVKSKFPPPPLSFPSSKATSLYPPRNTGLSFSLNQDSEDCLKCNLVVVPLTFWSEGWEIWSSCSVWLVSYNEFSLLVIVSFCNSWIEIQPFSSLFLFLLPSNSWSFIWIIGCHKHRSKLR